MHSGGQYLGPLLDIFMDIQKEHRSKSHNGSIIVYVIVWHLGYVLVKYFDLYLASEMEIYLYNILILGSKVRTDFY